MVCFAREPPEKFGLGFSCWYCLRWCASRECGVDLFEPSHGMHEQPS